jgi:hypothetical protein
MYPNFTPKHDTFAYWTKVEVGTKSPDEWQTALIKVVQAAQDSGLFYNKDIYEYVKKNAEFIPADAWKLQFDSHPTERGVIGYEIYFAGIAIREAARRKSNLEIEGRYPIGCLVGTLSVNEKKYTGLTVTEYKRGEVKLEGKAGSYKVTVVCEPRNIETMKQRAIDRKWRKA